jgi:DNA-binding NarL/FixJ family response regulator
MSKKIFIVEDHPAIRKEYRELIAYRTSYTISGECDTAEDALVEIVANPPDAVIMDISLAGKMNGVQLLRKLREIHRTLPVLVVSTHDPYIYGDIVLEAGASGYVMKGSASKLIENLIRIIEEPEQHISFAPAVATEWPTREQWQAHLQEHQLRANGSQTHTRGWNLGANEP